MNEPPAIPLISVVVLAYQHGPYIAECLDSILGQEGDFDLEIIIGEDASTDQTAAICASYASRYPGIIRLFHRDPSRPKWHICGRQTGRYNLLESLEAVTGDYIAMVDGDDCWLDKNKLQAQLTYLQQHPDCALVFTRSLIRFSDGRPDKPWPANIGPDPLILQRADFYAHNILGDNTSACFFRTASIRGFMNWPWIWHISAFDRPLWIELTKHGYAACLPQAMLCRRRAGGTWDGLAHGPRLLFAIDQLVQMRQHMGLPPEGLQAMNEAMLSLMIHFPPKYLVKKRPTLRQRLFDIRRKWWKV